MERHLNPKTTTEGIFWRAKAEDRDEGPNGELVYKLVGEGQQIGRDRGVAEEELFDIDPLGGEVSK